MDLPRLREDAMEIFRAGVRAADPIKGVKKYFGLKGDCLTVSDRSYKIADYRRIFVVGAGKATAAMARAVEEILGCRITDGIINVKYGHGLPLERIRVNEAAHPIPDEAGLRGTGEIVRLLKHTGENDLVICLISGGGSALMPSPLEGFTLEDEQEITRRLIESGANIKEINAVRKHFSTIKGGRLALLACPSTLITLIISDVVGDDLSTIASGPTVPDSSTCLDCLNILEKYDPEMRCSAALTASLKNMLAGNYGETPKESNSCFHKCQNVIVASNIQSIMAASTKAKELEYNSLVLSSTIEGETREVALVHAAIAREIIATGQPLPRPACVISGGETTVTIKGEGLGGRNQEFALSAAMNIDGLEGTVILSGGTDGTDGPTDAAGAIVDCTTIDRARRLGLEAPSFLKENDSYNFLEPVGDLLITGPTLTNVMDLRLVMVG